MVRYGYSLQFTLNNKAVLRFRIWIRIRRIHRFWGLPDPHPDTLVRDMDMDPDPDPARDSSIIKKE